MERPVIRSIAPAALLLTTSVCCAQSPLEGTWRPDPEAASADQAPDVIELSDGMYECQTCSPPYRIKADGSDQSVGGNPRYDSVSVAIVDARTIKKTAKQGGKPVAEDLMTVSPDGYALIETQIVYSSGIQLTSQSLRLSRGRPGSHLVSGRWKLKQTDLANHEEDTTFKVVGDLLSMSDRMGRSYTAKLDGTEAPYNGSADITSVSVRMIDAQTLEESDRKGGKVIKISRFHVDSDGQTVHAQFDDTQGQVQQQTGHRIR
jgi:hypothetical protein